MHTGIGNVLRKGLKYLVPLLLCLLFVVLALTEDSSEQVKTSSSDTSPIEVPFTTQAIENYLEIRGFIWDGETVSKGQGSFSCTLTVTEADGMPVLLTCTMETLGDISPYKGQLGYAALQKAKAKDAEAIKGLYSALIEAMVPAVPLTKSQQNRGLERLSRCLEKEKTYSDSAKGWVFSFSSADTGDGFFTVTFTLRREGA